MKKLIIVLLFLGDAYAHAAAAYYVKRISYSSETKASCENKCGNRTPPKGCSKAGNEQVPESDYTKLYTKDGHGYWEILPLGTITCVCLYRCPVGDLPFP